MKLYIQNYIDQCLKCKLTKLTRVKTKQTMIITDSPLFAFSKLAVDLTGPYKIIENGNKYILTVQCVLTKYCVVVPIPNQSTSTITDALIKRFICIYGSPKIIKVLELFKQEMVIIKQSFEDINETLVKMQKHITKLQKTL